MNAEQFKYYRAKIKYHRTDDLRPDALPDGSEVYVCCLWIADENERYAGEYIFSVAGSEWKLPGRDLILEKEVRREEYKWRDWHLLNNVLPNGAYISDTLE